MQHYRFSVSRRVDLPAAPVYAVIADYHNGHPHILPKPYFVSLQVEQGGIGSGTVINFQMKVLGRLQDFRAAISEPEPGRVLEETNEGGGVVTRFVVTPENDQASLVTISTFLLVRNGFVGKIEGWLTAQFLQPIYRKELELLAVVARQ